MLDDENPGRRYVYRLERVEDGHALTIVIFYSQAQANTLTNHLDGRYRLMLGDTQVWPPTSSSRPIPVLTGLH